MVNERSLVGRAIDTFGKDHQTVVAVEELAELIQALTKVVRYGLDADTKTELVGEVADVEIVLDEIKMMYLDSVEDRKRISNTKEFKLRRLLVKLDTNENSKRYEE